MSLYLKNRFTGIFDCRDDIIILPSLEKCIWLNFVNAKGNRHYKVGLNLDEAKKFKNHLSNAITKVEEIRRARMERKAKMEVIA